MSEGAILIVDDNKPNREMLARRLARLGYSTLTADSGREALRLVREETIGLLLLDLMMPEMSGIEVLEQLRTTHSELELPVLMVSANTDSPQMVEAIDRGASDYLTKPIDFPVLEAKVRRHLQRKGVHPRPETLAVSSPSTPVLTAPTPGEMLNHYRLTQLLGKGGMGEVYRAQDTRLQREVAIKLIVSDTLKRGSFERLLLEARAVARISHPGVVAIYEVSLWSWSRGDHCKRSTREGRWTCPGLWF
jgi:DNA-binding response OmpR family regulator